MVKFSTSKYTISDESSLICVMPEHKDGEKKKSRRRRSTVVYIVGSRVRGLRDLGLASYPAVLYLFI